MKAVYISGAVILSAEQCKAFAGCHIENANAFSGVARGIDSAVVVGEYPEIEKALKAAGVTVEGETRRRPKAKAAE